MSTAQTELARPGSPPGLSADVSAAPHGTPAAGQPALRPPTRAEWTAAALSLLFHLLLMLVLLALLFPVQKLGSGTSIDGGLGTEEGNGELFDSVTIGSPDAGKGQDVEKTAVPTIEGVPAVEGALAGGSGSGAGRGHFDAIAALGTGGGGSGKGVGFFGTRSRADTVVFVVDMSGSMQDGDPPRFRRAVDELSRSLKAMDPSQKFFIFFYNNVPHPMFDQRSAKLVAATPAMRTKVMKWVATLQPDGGTEPDESIERALKLKPQVIYFLTDGEIPETVRENARKANEHKTVIHTIAFQTREGEEQLKGIAADNRGKYRFVP